MPDKQPRDQEMQERGDPEDSDENKDFLRDGFGTPDDMRTGPPRGRAPVNVEPVDVCDAARLARDQRAPNDLQELRAEAGVRADIHRQSSSAGATAAVSWH
jgi:hypothetical protein